LTSGPSHIDNIKGLLELLPDELSGEESFDMDASDKEEEEFKNDNAPTRKSKNDRRNSSLNRQQTTEFNKLLKDSQNLI